VNESCEHHVERSPAEIKAAVEKTKSETAKNAAESAKLACEASYFRAQERREDAEAGVVECAYRGAVVAQERMDEMYRRELNSDIRNHTYRFVGEVKDMSVSECMKELSYWDRTDPECDIKVIFYSSGGAVLPAMGLYDFLRGLSRSNGGKHHLATECSGCAASMAGILLQSGDKRVMGKESYILIHEITAGTYGTMGEMKDAVKFYERICARVVDIFTSRSSGKLTKKRMSEEWVNHDWWVDSDLALELGIVDEVN